MKRKLKITTIFICIILISFSCAKENLIENGLVLEDENIANVDTEFIAERPSKKPGNTPYDEDRQLHFTYEQAIKDCEFLFESLNSDYPFEGILYRKYGLTLDSLKARFIMNLADHKNTMTIDKFALILKKTIQAFQGLGHIRLVDYNGYNDLKSILKEIYGADDERFTVLMGENTRLVYDYFSSNTRRSFLTIPAADKVNNSSELLLKSLSEDTAYMKIPSMKAGADLKNDYSKMMKFYEEVSDHENLIIDIIGNGGGDDWYWINNIVMPNISKTIKTTNYFLMKCSDRNSKFFEQKIGKNVYEFLSEQSASDGLPLLNSDDYKMSGGLFKTTKEISPLKEGKRLFGGNIYLLVNEGVYSSAESFAMFCRQTGFAYIIGEGTGGDGGGIEPLFIALPDSGLIIRYTILNVLNGDGSSNVEFGTKPGYICEENENPLDVCLKIINSASVLKNN